MSLRVSLQLASHFFYPLNSCRGPQEYSFLAPVLPLVLVMYITKFSFYLVAQSESLSPHIKAAIPLYVSFSVLTLIVGY